MFKLGSVIYSNVLKEVSSKQGCIYLYRKKIHAPKIVLCWYRMSDRMLKKKLCSVNVFKLLFCNFFFYLTVKSTFGLFNLCNGEKK